MENNPISPEKQASRNTGATVCIGFILALLLLCLSLFMDSPSFAYILIFYASFVIFTLAVIVIMLVRRRLKIYAGLITVGAAIGIYVAVMSQSFITTKMLTGQIVCGVFILLHVLLIVLVWLKRKVNN